MQGHAYLKEARTQSRSCCFLSPWMAVAPKERRLLASWSHMRLVEQNMMTRLPGGWLRRMTCSRFILSYGCARHSAWRQDKRQTQQLPAGYCCTMHMCRGHDGDASRS